MKSPLIILASGVLIMANLIGLVNLMGPRYFPSSFQKATRISIPPVPAPVFPDQELLNKVISQNDPAWFFIQAGKLSEAATELSKREKDRSEDSDFLRLYAIVLRMNGNNFEALRRYNFLIERYSRDLDLRLSRARTYSSLLRFNEAKKDIAYVLERQPDNQEANMILLALEKVRGYEEEKTRKMKTNLKRGLLLERAKNLEARKLFVPAIQSYREMIKINPQDTEAGILLARALAISGDSASAIKSYAKLRQSHPNNIEVLLDEAAFLMNAKKYKSASKNFKRVMKLAPSNKKAKQGLETLVERIKGDIDEIEKKDKLARLSTIKKEQKKSFKQKKFDAAETILKKGLKEFPDNAGLLAQKTRALQFQKKFAEALPFAEKLNKQNPGKPDYLNLRAGILFALGKQNEAETDYKKILEIDPANKDAAQGLKQIMKARKEAKAKWEREKKKRFIEEKLALARKADDDKEKAISIYREILMNYPDNTDAALELANALDLTGKKDKAETLYLQLRKMNPDNANVPIGLGYLYFRKSEIEKAEENFKAAQKMAPDHPEVKKGMKLIQKRNFNIRKNRAIAEAWKKSEDFFNQNLSEEAVQALNHVLKVYPGEPATRFQLGKLHLKNNSLQKAFKIFNELTVEYPGNVDFLTFRALTQLEMKREENAKKDLLLAQELAPNNQIVKRALEILQRKASRESLERDILNRKILGQHHAIIERLEQEIEKNPEDADLRFMLAQFQSSAGRTKDALATYEGLLRDYPDNFDYLLGRGLALKKLNQSERAKQDFLLALEIEPESIDARLGLGDTLVMERNFLEGARQFKNILSTDEENPDALESLREIENFTTEQWSNNTFIETFSNRSARFNTHAEWIHPISSNFRSRIGKDFLQTRGIWDLSVFAGASWDPFPGWNLGFRAGAAPSSDLFPEYFHEEEINYHIPHTSLNLSLLYRYMDFQPDPFQLFVPGLTYQVSDNLRATARAYLGFQKQGNTRSGYLKLNYDLTPDLSAYIGGVYGIGGFRTTTNQETVPADTYAIQSGFRYRISRRFAIGFNHEYEDREGQFKRNVFGIDFPMWF